MLTGLAEGISNAVELMLAIFAFPYQFLYSVGWEALTILTFDVLKLGPYLPIQIG